MSHRTFGDVNSQKTHKGSASEVIDVLTHERDELTTSLATKQRELQAFRQQVGHLAVKSEDGIVEPTIQRALKLNEALMIAQEERINLQATQASIQMAHR